MHEMTDGLREEAKERERGNRHKRASLFDIFQYENEEIEENCAHQLLLIRIDNCSFA